MLSIVAVDSCHQQPKIIYTTNEHLLLEFRLAVGIVDYAQPEFGEDFDNVVTMLK